MCYLSSLLNFLQSRTFGTILSLLLNMVENASFFPVLSTFKDVLSTRAVCEQALVPGVIDKRVDVP